ncbi:MAG: hypothetical protein KKG94_05110 [Nanoarchaeota archaeon]|nr:hypothetical protein [Candidatus Woesearchaeota archaeon]MBU4117104.1 hypothetical protein [Nanoarchaeota archaeon]
MLTIESGYVNGLLNYIKAIKTDSMRLEKNYYNVKFSKTGMDNALKFKVLHYRPDDAEKLGLVIYKSVLKRLHFIENIVNFHPPNQGYIKMEIQGFPIINLDYVLAPFVHENSSAYNVECLRTRKEPHKIKFFITHNPDEGFEAFNFKIYQQLWKELKGVNSIKRK